MKEGNTCGVCKWIAPLILAVTALLLLLVQLGTIDPTMAFGMWVAKWWPAGVFLYAVSGFCPCKSCKM